MPIVVETAACALAAADPCALLCCVCDPPQQQAYVDWAQATMAWLDCAASLGPGACGPMPLPPPLPSVPPPPVPCQPTADAVVPMVVEAADCVLGPGFEGPCWQLGCLDPYLQWLQQYLNVLLDYLGGYASDLTLYGDALHAYLVEAVHQTLDPLLDYLLRLDGFVVCTLVSPTPCGPVPLPPWPSLPPPPPQPPLPDTRGLFPPAPPLPA